MRERCVALWISLGLDTFRSVAPNWSPFGRALRTGEKEDERGGREERLKRDEGGIKGQANLKDKRDRGMIRERRMARSTTKLRARRERKREKKPRAKMERG